MYINRKTGELVEAEFVDMSGFIRNQWEIFHSNGSREYITDGEFQKKYGEAMICPNVGMCKCFHKEPHIKHYRCKSEHRIKACGECIPYTPEQKDPDEGLEVRPEIIERLEKSRQIPKEELLTSGQMREKLGIGQSNLMLSDEEIRKIFSQIEDVLIDSGLVLNDIMPELRKVAQAELDHLKGLGIVYVKDEYTCDWCNGNKKYKLDSGVETDCLCCSMNGKKYNYISLSDYKGQL